MVLARMLSEDDSFVKWPENVLGVLGWLLSLKYLVRCHNPAVSIYILLKYPYFNKLANYTSMFIHGTTLLVFNIHFVETFFL